jgi:hypothetical protein
VAEQGDEGCVKKELPDAVKTASGSYFFTLKPNPDKPRIRPGKPEPKASLAKLAKYAKILRTENFLVYF